MGARDSDQIVEVLQATDLFALTPRMTDDGDRDGMPNVLVEAMACGVPVVTTAAGGVPELVRDDVNGLLSQPGDVTGVADALTRLLRDPGLRARLGAAARHSVEEDHDVNAAAPAAGALPHPRGERPGGGQVRDVVALAQAARFAEALRPGVMGPRLAPVSGAGPGAAAPCHVLDAKYEPGVRAVLLYEQDGRLLRGDLVDRGDAMATTGPRSSSQGGAVGLPARPGASGAPARHGSSTARAGSVRGRGWRLQGRLDARQASRCRITLLRYRPGKRATVLVPRRCPAVVAKAYQPGEGGAVVEEAPDLHAATKAAGCWPSRRPWRSSRISPWSCSRSCTACRSTRCWAALAGPGTEPPRRSCTLPGRWPSSAAPVMSTRQRPVEKELPGSGSGPTGSRRSTRTWDVPQRTSLSD